MNTLQNSTGRPTNNIKEDAISSDGSLIGHFEITKDFFQTDHSGEMIGSIHRMIEEFLFSENLVQVTPEMRVHIVNNLLVATSIAQLGDCYWAGVRHY